MNTEEMKDKLEKLNVPEIKFDGHKKTLRLTLVNMNRSHKVGYFLVLVPLLFLFGILFTHVLHINIPIVDDVEQLMARWDKVPYLKLVFPILYLLLPLIALILNLLASLHFSWDSKSKELNIIYRFRLGNFIIIIFSFFILTIFFIYLIMENG